MASSCKAKHFVSQVGDQKPTTPEIGVLMGTMNR